MALVAVQRRVDRDPVADRHLGDVARRRRRPRRRTRGRARSAGWARTRPAGCADRCRTARRPPPRRPPRAGRASGPGPSRRDDLAGGFDDGCPHLTAPSDRPWTSLSWAAKPAASTGRDTTTDAAHTWARNRPWLVTKPVRKTGAVCGDDAGEHPREQQLVPAEDEADQRGGGDAGHGDRRDDPAQDRGQPRRRRSAPPR